MELCINLCAGGHRDMSNDTGLVVGIDGDDVLWDTSFAIRCHLRDKYKEPTTPRTTFNLASMTPKMCSDRLNAIVWTQDTYEIFNPRTMPLVDGAKQFCQRVHALNIKIFVVSSNPIHSFITDMCYDLKSLIDGYIITPSGHDKTMAKVHFLLDDSVANVQHYNKNSKIGRAFVFRQNWNIDDCGSQFDGSFIPSVDGFNAAYDAVVETKIVKG